MNKPDIDPVTRHCSSCDGIHYGDTGDCVYKRTPMPPEKPTTWPDSPAEKMRMEAHDAAITLAHTGDYGPVFRAIDALADALVKASSTMPESPAPQPAPCRICGNPMQEPNRAFHSGCVSAPCRSDRVYAEAVAARIGAQAQLAIHLHEAGECIARVPAAPQPATETHECWTCDHSRAFGLPSPYHPVLDSIRAAEHRDIHNHDVRPARREVSK